MNACCRNCRGPAPHHFCTNQYKGVLNPGCECHQKQDAIARKKRANLYTDRTADKAISRADQAISNAMKASKQ